MAVGPSPSRNSCLLVLLVCALWTASAQPARATPTRELALDRSAPALDAQRALRALRLAQRDEKRREGLWLLGWGAANALGGSVAAGVEHHDHAWLAGSITSASFGAINALLALGLLDLSGKRRDAILREQARSDAELAYLRERERTGQLKSGQGFALNAGLDLAYLTAGALLFVLGGQHTRHADWERGAGGAMLGQGAFLLGFDLVCWLRSNRRAEALRLRF